MIPRQTAVFTFTVTAPATAGSYAFSWRMLQEGVTWFGDTASATITVTPPPPPPRAATLVGMTGVPSTVTAGQIFTVTIQFQNTGALTWQGASSNPSNPYRLGAVGDTYTWGPQRIELPASQIIPGQTAVFTFTVTAPATAGSYAFSWRMLQEGVTWFGDTASATITVTPPPPPPRAATLVGMTGVPSTVTAGQIFTVTIQFQNTGALTWQGASSNPSNPYRLGAVVDTYTWAPQPIELPASQIIPGQTAVFTFTVTAPATGGSYAFSWRMLQEGVTWFGDAASTTITVTPPRAATLVGMTGAPSTVTAGQIFTVTIQFQNTGALTWQGASSNPSNPYRLGAVGDTYTWGPQRIELPASQIIPGQTAVFTFTVTAPATAGSYAFSWRMLQEGVTWFGDTASATITVTPPPPPPRAATLVGMTGVPSTVTAGQIFTVTIQFQNTGALTWQGVASNPSNPYRLGAVGDTYTWGPQRIELPASQIIPGQTAVFTFTVRAPATAGSYAFSWEMLQEGVTWFGDIASTTITVGSS